MAKTQLQLANRNVRLYVFVKIFAKRVFFPLSAIYFVETFGFTIQEIGLLAAFFAVTQLFAEMPTGYFADRIARVTSIRIGALLNVSATLLYVFSTNKSGVFIGQFLEAIGYSFMAGAGEALIHDSLVVRKDTEDYSKILSRAQSVSLVINAGMIALIPMTYGIDPRIPFLIGTLAYAALFIFALFMQDVDRQMVVKERTKVSFSDLLKRRNIVAFGLLFGIIAALYTAPADFYKLAISNFGVKPELVGWLFAAASLVGAVMGIYIHLLKKLSFRTYMCIDSFILLLPFAAIYTNSILLTGTALIINIAFWRYRRIIYQAHLLTLYPTNYKATMLSAMSNVEQLNMLWMPVAIAFVVARFGFSIGFGIIGLFALLIIPMYVALGTRLIRNHATKN